MKDLCLWSAAVVLSLFSISCNESVTQDNSGNGVKDPRYSDRPNRQGTPENRGSYKNFRIEELDISNPRSAWDEIANLEFSANDLKAAEEDLIARLCRDRGLQDAVKLISQVKGIGTERNYLLEVAFAYSRDMPGVILSQLEGLSDPKERLAAANGLHLNESIQYDDFRNSVSLSPEAANLFLNRASISIPKDDQRPERADPQIALIRDLIERGVLNENHFLTFVKRASFDHPFLAWQIMTKSPVVSSSPEAYKATLDEIGRSMANIDPQAGIEAVIANQETEGIAETIFGSWLKKDFDRATEWLSASNEPFGISVTGGFQEELGNYYADSGDWHSAVDSIAMIEDPVRREQAADRLWNHEKDAATAQMGQDFGGFLNSLTNGSLPYTDRVAEVAMTSWIKEKPDEASDWYDENASSLSPTIRQEVAVSYANHYLEQGDLHTAGLWVETITDPSARKRLLDASGRQ